MSDRDELLKHDIRTLNRLIREYPMRTIENVRDNLVARLREEGYES